MGGSRAVVDSGREGSQGSGFMGEPKVNELMEKIVSLCKRRGFVYPSSEI